jgi:cytoskeletal protein RodZ
MKTVGTIFKETRLEKKISLAEAEQATKIRQKFLIAIEADDYSIMPSLSYAKGFVKNYCKFLGLDSEKILAFFRRQNAEMPKASLLPKGEAEQLNPSFFQLTTTRFVALIIGMLAVSFLFYFGLQYRKIQLPPKLIINSPADQSVVSDKRIDILGTTDIDASVTINGVSTLIRSDGKFFDRVSLDNGVNTVLIVAVSRYGKTQTVKRTVTLLP